MIVRITPAVSWRQLNITLHAAAAHQRIVVAKFAAISNRHLLTTSTQYKQLVDMLGVGVHQIVHLRMHNKRWR